MKTKFHFDPTSSRMVIGDSELHCGDCFELKIGLDWHSVRIEHSNSAGGWYLVGLPKYFRDCAFHKVFRTKPQSNSLNPSVL